MSFDIKLSSFFSILLRYKICNENIIITSVKLNHHLVVSIERKLFLSCHVTCYSCWLNLEFFVNNSFSSCFISYDILNLFFIFMIITITINLVPFPEFHFNKTLTKPLWTFCPSILACDGLCKVSVAIKEMFEIRWMCVIVF